MSVSKRFLRTRGSIKAVVDRYCAEDKPTVAMVAKSLGETFHTVSHILAAHLPAKRYRIEKAIRYSRSKKGAASPMYGRRLEAHPNWKGDVSDCKGYLTRKCIDRVRRFVHRIVMAQMLGIHPSQLPARLQVHHIDEDPHNNTPDNLALVTRTGHHALHQKRSELEKLPLWIQYVSGTSRLKRTTPTRRKGS